MSHTLSIPQRPFWLEWFSVAQQTQGSFWGHILLASRSGCSCEAGRRVQGNRVCLHGIRKNQSAGLRVRAFSIPLCSVHGLWEDGSARYVSVAAGSASEPGPTDGEPEPFVKIPLLLNDKGIFTMNMSFAHVHCARMGPCEPLVSKDCGY